MSGRRHFLRPAYLSERTDCAGRLFYWRFEMPPRQYFGGLSHSSAKILSWRRIYRFPEHPKKRLTPTPMVALCFYCSFSVSLQRYAFGDDGEIHVVSSENTGNHATIGVGVDTISAHGILSLSISADPGNQGSNSPFSAYCT